MQESAYKGEVEVGDVAGKDIKRRKYYNINFQIGFVISHKEIK